MFPSAKRNICIMRNQYVAGYGIIDSMVWLFAILPYASSMLLQYIHVTLITWGNVRAYCSWCSKSTKFCNLGTVAIYTMVRVRLGYTKAIYLVLSTPSHCIFIDEWLSLRWYSDQDRNTNPQNSPTIVSHNYWQNTIARSWELHSKILDTRTIQMAKYTSLILPNQKLRISYIKTS